MSKWYIARRTGVSDSPNTLLFSVRGFCCKLDLLSVDLAPPEAAAEVLGQCLSNAQTVSRSLLGQWCVPPLTPSRHPSPRRKQLFTAEKAEAERLGRLQTIARENTRKR